ncbi:transcription factor bHLH68 [Citrus sinensis]|uniref:Transcription factor bHLH68 n=1 Tax=Citrus sinensis TaxID=2711 RepID=A0ACB8JBI1_CITSI|nr:transcription factor bHLH68 [Citrus sinensis]
MMAGNPSWWSMHPLNPHQLSSPSSPSLFPSQYVHGSSSSFPFNSLPDSQEQHPQSWSQLLLSGLPSDDDGFNSTPIGHFHQPKKFESWEDHHLQIINPYSSSGVDVVDDVKQEAPQANNLYLHGAGEFQATAASNWPQIMPLSPRSCVTSLSSNILDFSHTKPADKKNNQQHPDHSSEVRKEKLGDRITALHQLVSPFGKTDTASVLLEAIGYIRFLQGQIEALSSPYLSTSPSASMRNQHCVHGDINGAFPEAPGQLLNDTCLKRKEAPNQDGQGKPKDLRSRGLCLVPLSCTQQVGSDNGADFWAPALGGGF